MKRVQLTFVLILIASIAISQVKITMKKENGVYMVPCIVNGLPLNFIFDTGASDVSISLTESIFMIKNGYLRESDFIGTESYRIANGEIVDGTKIVIRELKIGNKIVKDIQASIIHKLSAPLLLGQSAIQKFGKYSIDYSTNTLLLGEITPTTSNDQTISQDGYKIDFNVKGLQDTTTYLGYYYGESTYVTDTARVSHEGSFSFSGKKTLPQGVYLLVMNKTKIFDFVVSQDQFFSLETNTEDYVKNMKVTDDQDNKLFFENMMHNMERGKEADPFVKVLQDTALREENKNVARTEFNKVSRKVMAYQDDLIKKYPATLTARILKANKSIEIPESPRLPNGRIDSSFQFKYYKAHYWDNFDLADDAMIRMPKPFYMEKLKDYLNKMVAPQADSLMKEINKLGFVARKNQETYKYLIWMCVVQYQNAEVMGLDAVYVQLFDKYFASKEMDFWINEKTKKNLKDHADQLRLSLIGQTAPNLIMQDQNLQPKNMYDIKKKYTILFIFDPDCGHCREETPKLVNFYNAHKTKFDLEVYAVSADSSMQKMKDYIKEMKMPWITVNGPRSYVGSYQKLYDAAQTPSIYIIDSKKKIIAKKPPIEKLEDFLTHYEMSIKKKNSSP